MAYSVTPLIGVNLSNITTLAELELIPQPPFKIGTQIWGDDGKLYVYAKANAPISASDTDCAVNASTFLATASGGTYTSPPTAMVSGEYGWFGKASV